MLEFTTATKHLPISLLSLLEIRLLGRLCILVLPLQSSYSQMAQFRDLGSVLNIALAQVCFM